MAKEKLIELIGSVQYGNGSLIGNNFQKGFIEKIADHLIANGVTLDNQVSSSKWIPVTEGLPALHIDDYEEFDGSRMQFEVSDDQWVITASGDQTKARYELGVVFQGWVGDYGNTIRNVTHWMPLPEPPKGD